MCEKTANKYASRLDQELLTRWRLLPNSCAQDVVEILLEVP